MIRIVFAIAALLLAHPAQAQLRGHGGPVRALAISPDGKTAVSGSFDTSAIRWSLTRNAVERPDAQGHVIGSADQRLAVRRERDAVDVLLMVLEHARFAAGKRPQPDAAVP